ncbi:uncharacterized protein RAG0_13929 [Rhynchosporium agropyri]|uniref:Uncharacterized protein n=1 Tax=Rhynchosporium agropyri TaxID=914238 RepID=A0A1E1LEU2_9HELO|nr:uncharacterized protein RAG0_13929 [Rhynchosporium agropyri]
MSSDLLDSMAEVAEHKWKTQEKQIISPKPIRRVSMASVMRLATTIKENAVIPPPALPARNPEVQTVDMC